MKVKKFLVHRFTMKIDDIVQKMQLQFQNLTEDDKLAELQTLIMNQRKTINTLTKTNAELSHAVKNL